MTLMNDMKRQVILKKKLKRSALLMMIVPLVVIYIVSGTLFSVFGAKYWLTPLDMLRDIDCSQWAEKFIEECTQQYLYGEASSYSVWRIHSIDQGDDQIFSVMEEELFRAGYYTRITPLMNPYSENIYLGAINESGSFVKYLTLYDVDVAVVQKEIPTDTGVITVTALNLSPERNAKVLFWLCILFVVGYTISLAYFANDVLQIVQQPLDILRAGTKKIVDGNYDERITYHGLIEFEELCNDFDVMRESLKEKEIREEELKEQRSLMLSGMSHDLATPLTSIRGYTEGMLAGYAEDESTQERYLKTIHARSLDMERMLGKLSDYAKFSEEIQYRFVIVDIVKVMKDYIDLLADEEVRVNLSPCEDCDVCIDTNEMYRVFQNLFENSLKYVEHRPVLIDIDMKKVEDRVVIRFRDDGEGVPEDLEEEIFKPFYRVDPARTKKGHGLGLSISRKIVEAQDGTIRAYHDNGFVVEISLPIYVEVN